MNDLVKLACILLRNHNYFLDEFAGFQNMWDLTPDTDLLMELPEEYTFETALADLIVSLIALMRFWIFFLCLICC